VQTVDILCRMSERFEKHARTVTLLTLASRVTGLARDAALSRVFGVGLVMDAFFFAFMIPNLFRRLFGEGALSAAFLPVYSRLDRDDPEQAKRLASLTMALLVVVLGVLVLVGEAILFAISHMQGHGNLAIWLMMVMLPYMPMVCVVAILGAMLQVHGRFGPTAAAPMILNLLIVAAAVGLVFVLDTDDESQRAAHIGMVAASVIVAGVIQVSWSVIALRSHAWWRRDWASAWLPMKRVMAQAGPMILGLGVLQLNTLFDGLIASYPTVVGETIFGIRYPLDEGAMATVSFAQRLYQFPLGVFGIAIATAIFPALAALSDRADDFAGVLRRGLRLVVFIGLPASVGLILVREPLTAVVLQGGDFTVDDTRRVGFVLLGYAPAIWAYSMVHVLTRGFYARGDSATPVKIACGVVALNLILNCTLIWTPLREAGLAWSTAICSFVQVVLLSMFIRRHIQQVVDRDVVASWIKSTVVSGVMGAIVVGLWWFMATAGPSWSRSLIELGVLVATGGVVVLVLSRLMRMPELAWAIGRATNGTT
jgi:putative peptidoglycan lipid II flippase